MALPTATAPPAPAWGTCPLCGDAYPPNASKCPTCGEPLAGGPRPRRPLLGIRRPTALRSARALLVAVVVVGLAFALVGAIWSGPPVLADPLTTSGTYTIGPGNFTILQGQVTGEDYITGNFTVVAPAGTAIALQVFNDSEFAKFAHHETASAAYEIPPSSSSRIVFVALYTDTYTFVFENEYVPSSGIAVQVHVTTSYESNVVLG